MITVFLRIVSLTLGILDRYLEEQNRLRGQKEDEEFKKALGRSDLELIADKLSKRLRLFQERNNRAKRP